MGVEDFLREVNEEVGELADPSFSIEITETRHIPHFNDSAITYPNLDTGVQKCKLIETCVLYVDMRGSTALSAKHGQEKLAQLYSAFVRAMAAAARYYGGHVRNIVGDRVMVVFDSDGCFEKAKDTAVLMNTLASHVLNGAISGIPLKCGIGIDHGSMLITKAGLTRHGSEKEFYRSLVWLGKPANIASKLTDLANKSHTTPKRTVVHEGMYYPALKDWVWPTQSPESFLARLTPTYSRNLLHEAEYFSSFFTTTERGSTIKHPPILITQAVYDGLKSEVPSWSGFKKKWLKPVALRVSGYKGTVWGGDVVLIAGRNH